MSTGATFSDSSPHPEFKAGPLFDVEYLRNGSVDKDITLL